MLGLTQSLLVLMGVKLATLCLENQCDDSSVGLHDGDKRFHGLKVTQHIVCQVKMSQRAIFKQYNGDSRHCFVIEIAP